MLKALGVVLSLIGFALAVVWFGWKLLGVILLVWLGRNLLEMYNEY